MLLEDSLLLAKGVPPVLWKESKKPLRPIPQLDQAAVDFGRREHFLPRDLGHVPDQVLNLYIADGDPKVLAGDFFNFMRFVEDDSQIVRKQCSKRLIPHRQVGKKQMVIHDDDVALGGPAMHFRNKAPVEL